MNRSLFLFACVLLGPIVAIFSDELQPNIPESATAPVAQSKELRIDKHDAKAAEAVLKQVIETYPNYYKAHYNLGLVYQDKGEYDSAIVHLEKARAIREKENLQDYSIYNTLGWVYMLKGDMAKAEEAYKIALQYESKNSPESNTRLYNNLAWFYYNSGKPDVAKKYIDVAVNKYHSKAALEMGRLVDQLQTDQKKIDAKSDILQKLKAAQPRD